MWISTENLNRNICLIRLLLESITLYQNLPAIIANQSQASQSNQKWMCRCGNVHTKSEIITIPIFDFVKQWMRREKKPWTKYFNLIRVHFFPLSSFYWFFRAKINIFSSSFRCHITSRSNMFSILWLPLKNHFLIARLTHVYVVAFFVKQSAGFSKNAAIWTAEKCWYVIARRIEIFSASVYFNRTNDILSFRYSFDSESRETTKQLCFQISLSFIWQSNSTRNIAESNVIS